MKPAYRSNHRGTALLEFALVIIVLCMMLFGIIDFGRALYTYHFVANAAREATRYASVRGSGCKVPGTCPAPATASDVTAYVTSITPAGINATDVVVDTQWTGSGPGSSANGGCNTSGGSNSPGCDVWVQVSYPFKFVFPLMPTSLCSLGQSTSGNICFKSTSVMMISQ